MAESKPHLLARGDAEGMSIVEIFAKTKEKLGLPADADYATVVATVDETKRQATRNSVCDKLGIPRTVSDETMWDAVYAAVAKPAQPSTDSGPRPTRDGEPFALNPHLEAMRAKGLTPGTGASPTLFPAGDLPQFTASGNDPKDLLHLPACLRHAAAKADAAEWARLFNSFATGSPDDDLAAQFDPAAQDVGNLEYEDRFRAWRRGDQVD